MKKDVAAQNWFFVLYRGIKRKKPEDDGKDTSSFGQP